TPEGALHLLAKPYFTLGPGGSLELHHVPVPEKAVDPATLPPEERRYVDQGGDHTWLRQTVNALGARVKGLAQRITRYQPVPEYDDADSPAWRLMRAVLERWIGEARAPVVICPIPLYHYIEELASPRGYQARFADVAQATGDHL